MKITLKNKEYKLDFDIGFALALDEKHTVKQSIGGITELEFGLGIANIYPRLISNDLRAIIDVVEAALTDVKTVSYTKKDLNKAVSAKIKEVGSIPELCNEIIDELGKVGLYGHILNPELSEEMKEDIKERMTDLL